MANDNNLNIDNDILNRVSLNGYRERDLDTIRNTIQDEVKDILPELNATLGHSLVDNLISVGSVIIKQNEGLLKYLFNSISLPSVSNQLFDLIAQDYSVSRFPSTKASVDMKISKSKPGYIINQNTIFTNDDKTVQFYTTEPLIVNSLGEVSFVAISDNLEVDLKNIKAGDINQLLVPDDNIKTVTNINPVNLSRPIEDITQFKLRVQNRLRNNIQGSINGLQEAIKEIQGVNPLQVLVQTKQQEVDQQIYNGVEVIVGGGSVIDIANTIIKYIGLNPRVLVSAPSNREVNRTITQEISSGFGSFKVVFTRPKIILLDLIYKPKLFGVTLSNNQLEGALSETFIEFFRKLDIRRRLGKLELQTLFLNTINQQFGVNLSNIADLQIEYKIDGVDGNFSVEGLIEEQFPDTYLQLNAFKVAIQD